MPRQAYTQCRLRGQRAPKSQELCNAKRTQSPPRGTDPFWKIIHRWKRASNSSKDWQPSLQGSAVAGGSEHGGRAHLASAGLLFIRTSSGVGVSKRPVAADLAKEQRSKPPPKGNVRLPRFTESPCCLIERMDPTVASCGRPRAGGNSPRAPSL